MTDFRRLRILIKQEERYRWAVMKQQSKAEKITVSLSQSGGMSKGRVSSKVEDGAIMLAALKDEYNEIKTELKEAQDELSDTIKRIRNPKRRLEKTCIRMRYIQGMSVRKIAISLSYTEDYLHRKMREAEALIHKLQTEQESKNK